MGRVWDDNTFVGTLTADDLEIDSSTLNVDPDNNRVGIGTATPTSTLELEASSGDLAIEIDNNASNAANLRIVSGAGNSRVDFEMDGNNHLTMKGQRVAIVGTNPTATLDVTGDGKLSTSLTVGTDLTVSGGDITYGNGQNATAAVAATAHDAAGKNLTITAGPTTAGTTNNIAGGALTLQGGQGKGSGAGGDIIFQTANASGSGSSLNSHATALTISDDLSATFAGDVVVNNAFAAAGASGTFGTFADGDGTPSVAAGNLWKHHASAQTITMFDDGLIGQVIHVISTDAITYDVTSTNLKGGSADIVTANGDITSWFFDGTDWYLVQFMDVSADHSSVGGGGVSLANDGNNRVTTGTGSGGINGEANLLFDGSTLKVNGGVGANVRGTGASGLTGTVTVAATDYFLGCDPSGGTVTCNLPAPSIAGQMFVIKDTDGTASGTNKITITAQAGDSIDGGSTGGSVHITTPNASVTIITDGTHWFLI